MTAGHGLDSEAIETNKSEKGIMVMTPRTTRPFFTEA